MVLSRAGAIGALLVVFLMLVGFDVINIQINSPMVTSGYDGSQNGASSSFETSSSSKIAKLITQKAKKSWKSPVAQDYAFRMYEPGSFEPHHMGWCPGLREVDLKPVDETLKYLFILGAQKAGTSWLHEALTNHPAFVEASNAYKGGWAKEVRFFNSYPQGRSEEFVKLFPKPKQQVLGKPVPTVYLDSSPWYLFSPSVAPRIKQMVPQAKFVVVLRDPVARTVSSHNMMKEAEPCWKGKAGEICWRMPGTLLEMVQEHRDLEFKWPEDLSGCNFNETVENVNDRRTWGGCWRCDHWLYDCDDLSEQEQKALGGCSMKLVPRSEAHMQITHMGLYAAQLAWWLSFFPPESFLVFTREELLDPDRVVPAMNRILDHVGLDGSSGVRRFNPEEVGKVKGFVGKYAGGMSEEDQQALKELAQFFERPNQDLQTLMDTFFPHAGFKGFTPEYSDKQEDTGKT